jgi:hypothetical protein
MPQILTGVRPLSGNVDNHAPVETLVKHGKPARRLTTILCEAFMSNLWDAAQEFDGNFLLFSLRNNGCDRLGC